MAKKIESLEKIWKSEKTLAEGNQYYREVDCQGCWKFGMEMNSPFIAFSKIYENDEMLVAMNIGSDNTVETRVTVDKELTPVGTKMKDLMGRSKNYYVEEEGGRNFIRMTLKPNYISVLKKSS